jgi:ABC-type sugar transport system ATPase subunit
LPVESKKSVAGQGPAVALREISKRFGSNQALSRVSLDILPGEVHALVGENGAGKSTLMNILGGELQPDDGEILIGGVRVRWRDPHHSATNGINVVHQELSLCLNLTVLENVGLARAASNRAWQFVDRRRMKADADRLLRSFGFPSEDLDKPVHHLPLGRRQLVDIAKALTTNIRVLVLDEPNSALTADDSERLFRVVRELRGQGVGILYVSHRLEEVLALADRITVLRDGVVVDSGPKSTYSIDGLIRKMVGREIDHLFHRNPAGSLGKQEIFAVNELSDRKLLTDISLSVREGEILGVAGLPGSGKDELIDCLTGLRAFSGRILIDGKVQAIGSPHSLLRNGVAIVPADRRTSGVIQVLSVQDNVASASLRKLSRFGILSRTRMRDLAYRYVGRFRIKASSLEQKVGTLSGGNQQKVILARNLATEPRVLLLHEPTRGIDVGAKAEIYQIINELAGRGLAVLIASSELPELIGQCDRILTLCRGRISGVFNRSEFDEHRLLAAALGQNVVEKSSLSS